MAAVPALDPNDMGVCRFIADTGCGYKLAGKDRVKRANAENYIRNPNRGVILQTAGGDVLCNKCIYVQRDAFPEGEFNALVLNQTPSVVSVGQRCLEMGYSFHWLPCSKEPYFEAPDGAIIPVVVYGSVPHLERLKAVNPAVPAELGEEDTAAPRGSQPEGQNNHNRDGEGAEPIVGDGDEWF